VITLAEPLRSEKISVGDHLLVDARTQYGFEKMPKSSVEEVMLEEIPDISYEDIGGLGDQIEVLRDSVELPYLHPEIFSEFELKPPKGILLYGPPGCGKTMIAKAVANSLARKIEDRTGETTTAYFLNVKGPELLNKYVGETESKLREVFKKARDKAAGANVPVVIFFDEMDSLFRMRGSGVSSDMEATVVAQFLSEIDGVEALENVIVIGASNRQDLIDPAVLRPGRLDLKVKVQRPDETAAREIFAKYLTDRLPIDPDAVAAAGSAKEACSKMIGELITMMYSTGDENKFLEVTYAKGEREIFYFKDFSSGAMIENIVARAKRKAVKRAIAGEQHGITANDLTLSVKEEFKENEDLPNTTNPDDWARISGRKGERIINVRTLISGMERKEESIETVAGSGQYL
ncbi:MAG: proteasome ATPase, partial [bacterium]